MPDCYQIKSPEKLIDYLKTQGRDAFHDFDYQLKTNYGFVHELLNGHVIFFDNHFKHKAILFDNKKCFEDVIKADRFPVDIPDRDMFDVEGDRIKSFHLQTDYYRNHLNNVLKLDFPYINKEAAQAYLKKVIGRFIKKLTTATDVVALISVIGELVKAETNGKWFLDKSYGTYNPIYEPNIVTASGNVILIGSKIIGMVKWISSKLEDIFLDVHSTLDEPIKWDKYSKHRSDLILLG
jgi:hypothetical protein